MRAGALLLALLVAGCHAQDTPESCDPDLGTGIIDYVQADSCMEANKTFPHPGVCPLHAVCASYVRSSQTWLCHDGLADPTQCDADKERIVLLGRKARASLPVGPEPCINHADCGETERCYARRCDTARTAGTDEERLYAYINGACGTLSPHVRAELVDGDNTAVGPLVTVRCVVDIPDNITDWKVLMTLAQEWPQRETQSGFLLTDGKVSTNILGQLHVHNPNEFDPILLNRRFDTRAKAEACSLCSLYTARNYNTAAFVTSDTYWECAVYARGQSPPNGAVNCTATFGDNIYVVREGLRELETIGFATEGVAPAYLASGIVPRDITQEWQAFTLAPPLFSAEGGLYVSNGVDMRRTTETLYAKANQECSTDGGLVQLPNVPNCKREISAFELPHVDGLFYQFASKMDTLPSDLRALHPHFARIWGFLNYAGGPEDYRSNRENNEYFNPVRIIEPNIPHGGSLVTDSICSDQPSYCCLSGPDLNGRTITLKEVYDQNYNLVPGVQTSEGSIQCGHANTRFYGLNHAFRASVCPIAGGNWPPNLYGPEFAYRRGSLNLNAEVADSIREYGTGGAMSASKYAADVIVVPRTWQSGCDGTTPLSECAGKSAYGWALLDDLRDVDRTVFNREDSPESPAVCKHQPQQHDHCLRRDRGFASNTVREELGGHRCVMPLGGTVSSFGNLLQTIGTQEDICCDTAEAETCDPACLAYVTGDVTTVSTTPTSTTTTQVPIVQDDIVRGLVMYNNQFNGESGYQLNSAFDRELPGRSDAVCAAKYRYAATDMPEPLAVLTYSDASITAHTQCRDYCTAWDRCVAYSYTDPPDTLCRLYGNMSVPEPLTYRNVDANFGAGIYGWRDTNDNFGNDVLEIENPFATAVIEAFSAQLSLATAFDRRAVLRDFIRGGDDGTVASFDVYHGVVLCNLTGLNVTVVQTLTLNECIEQSRSAQANSFYWEGRLNKCTLIADQLNAPAAVSWTCDAPPGLCSGINVHRGNLNGDDTSHSIVTLVFPNGTSALLAVPDNLLPAPATGWNLTELAFDQNGITINATDSGFFIYVSGVAGFEAPADGSWWWNLYTWNATTRIWDVSPVSISSVVVANDETKHIAWAPSTVAALAIPPPIIALCDVPAFRYVDYGERVGVFGKRAANTCPASLTTTTTTETASIAASVREKVTFYTSLPQYCNGVEKPLYISPVYTEEMEGLLVYNLTTPVTGLRPIIVDSAVIGYGSYEFDRLYWDPKDPPARPCLESPPADRTVYGEVDTTTTASSTTTSSTPTFVNRFTEEDTNVAIGVAIGVFGLGVLLTVISARGHS